MGFAPSSEDPCANGVDTLSAPPSIAWRCDNCLMLERASVAIKRKRGRKAAMYWKVTKLIDDGKRDSRKGRGKGNNNPEEEERNENEPIVADTGKLNWGPGLL